MREEDTGTAGWEGSDQVRRTILLSRDVERALSEAAQRLKVSPGELIRDFIVQGLARLEKAEGPGSG